LSNKQLKAKTNKKQKAKNKVVGVCDHAEGEFASKYS